MLSNSGGRNGNFASAPNDSGNCGNCHSGGNNTNGGNITLTNIPNQIAPSTIYNMTLTMNDPTAVVGGFQIVATDGTTNTQSGTFSVIPGETKLNNVDRLVQSTPQAFNSNEVSWMIEWTSPATLPSNEIRFYFAGNAANGNGARDVGDFTYSSSSSVIPFGTIMDEDMDGIADNVDNCPTIPNPSQINNDMDSYGEACDCNDNDPNDDIIAVNDNPVTSGFYGANTKLTSTGVINNTGSVILQAGVEVILETGFIAEEGSDFEAIIDTCETPQQLITIYNEDFGEINQITSFDDKITRIGQSVDFSIFPNPSNERSYVNFELPQAISIRLSVLDLNGNQVLNLAQEQVLDKGSYSYEVDSSRLPSGIYIISMVYGKERMFKKMVVNK